MMRANLMVVSLAMAICLIALTKSAKLLERGWLSGDQHHDCAKFGVPWYQSKNDNIGQDSGQNQQDSTSPGPRDRVIPYPKRVRFNKRDQAALSAKRVMHMLSHTHWDREWYLSVEQFRGSLIMELDRVFAMLSNSSANFHHFHMDGQYLMVEDYLEVRPSMRATVADLNRRGKITLGPFYSQPDVFLASGEALIRNLMLGMSLSSDLGGTSTVGYVPDTFGFMGQMPQLLRGFGIKYFISGRFASTGSTEGCWIAPDGSTVLFAYLGNWYCHAIDSLRTDGNKPISSEDASKIVKILDADLTRAGANSKHRLAMYGCDHFMTDPNVGTTFETMNEAAGDIRIVQTNLDDYMKLLESDLDKTKLPEVRGEVREGVDMLINSASTKMSLKQQNFKIQTLLEKWVEPMEAYGWALGSRIYDSDRIWHAWKPVLQTHAHDSICSTSASSVMHDIVNRMSRAEQSAYRMIADQAGQIIPAIIGKVGSKGQVLVINPTNTDRSECFTFTLLSARNDYNSFTNVLDRGTKSVQPLVLASDKRPAESFELPNTLFRRAVKKGRATYLGRISLPPNGVALLQLSKADDAADTAIVETAAREIASLSNKYLEVIVHPIDGSCSVIHRLSGQTWTDVNKIHRSAEMGTSYLHHSMGKEEFIGGLTVVSKTASVLFSSIKLQGKLGVCTIWISYVLFADARSLQIQTSIDNSQRNNYVVTGFPMRRKGADVKDRLHVDVDGNFEYVDRSEMADRFAHQNRFVSVYSTGSSMTVANRGIPEYTFHQDAGRLQMTLIRGVNRIGDWIAAPLEDDISQELKTMTFQYAVIPDICRVTEPTCTADLEARNFVDPVGSYASWVVDGYRPERYINMDESPLSVVSDLRSRRSNAKMMPQLDETDLQEARGPQFFKLTPSKLILSAVKKAETKDALVARVYNPTNCSLDASVSPDLIPFSKVEYVLLNENDAREEEAFPIDLRDGNFHFTVTAHKIITLLLYI